MNRRAIALALAAPVLTGCMVLIGESFDGYVARGPDAGADAADSGSTFSSAPHAIGDCVPTFTVANGVGYPDQAPATFDVPPGTTGLVTDDDARCLQPAGLPKLPYCLLLASSVKVRGFLGAAGTRPLVVVGVHDVEISGAINVAGEDAFGKLGPGANEVGNANALGGGGASPTANGGDGCTGGGGLAFGLDAGLRGGGSGGGGLLPNPECHGGGNGGGALQIVSLCGTVKLTGNANLNANGGGGASVTNAACASGFGGGGGGSVWIQAASFQLDKANGATIDLLGGGGAGGTCRESAADPWTAGTNAAGRTQGNGATCTNATGGAGAIGADGPVADAGANGSATPPAESTCGGGGGAVGVAVLVTDVGKCTDSIGFVHGSCVDQPLH